MSPMNAASANARTSGPPSRYALIACAVVALHIGLVWLLQSGLLMRTAQQVVLVEVLTRLIDPPAPVVAPAPAPPKTPAPIEPPKAVPLTPRPPPQPRPRAAAEPLVVPALPVSPAVPDAPTATMAPPVQAAPMAAAPATAVPSAQPSPPPIQLPSSDADYLQNPPPPYPALSKRLNEQGKTTVKVLIGANGLPQRAEIVRSSGFERLDQAALATVMRWRYVPGKRGGVAEAMWFNVPINWVLE